jgi:hypothetical protein
MQPAPSSTPTLATDARGFAFIATSFAASVQFFAVSGNTLNYYQGSVLSKTTTIAARSGSPLPAAVDLCLPEPGHGTALGTCNYYTVSNTNHLLKINVTALTLYNTTCNVPPSTMGMAFHPGDALLYIFELLPNGARISHMDPSNCTLNFVSNCPNYSSSTDRVVGFVFDSYLNGFVMYVLVVTGCCTHSLVCSRFLIDS